MTGKEKYCSNCRYETKQITESPCNECCNIYTSKFESKTYYDKVKEMSLDELTEFLDQISSGRRKIDSEYKRMTGKAPDSKKIIRKWLESEVE